jgi:hypothetical protein
LVLVVLEVLVEQQEVVRLELLEALAARLHLALYPQEAVVELVVVDLAKLEAG